MELKTIVMSCLALYGTVEQLMIGDMMVLASITFLKILKIYLRKVKNNKMNNIFIVNNIFIIIFRSELIYEIKLNLIKYNNVYFLFFF